MQRIQEFDKLFQMCLTYSKKNNIAITKIIGTKLLEYIVCINNNLRLNLCSSGIDCFDKNNNECEIKCTYRNQVKLINNHYVKSETEQLDELSKKIVFINKFTNYGFTTYKFEYHYFTKSYYTINQINLLCHEKYKFHFDDKIAYDTNNYTESDIIDYAKIASEKNNILSTMLINNLVYRINKNICIKNGVKEIVFGNSKNENIYIKYEKYKTFVNKFEKFIFNFSYYNKTVELNKYEVLKFLDNCYKRNIMRFRISYKQIENMLSNNI